MNDVTAYDDSLPPSEGLYKSSKSAEENRGSQDSRSLADVPSECFVEEEQHSEKIIHGHILPSGWVCNYDPTRDTYKFEHYQPTHDTLSTEIERSPSKVENDNKLAKSPTTDHAVQTSRRPISDLFECQYGYHFPASPTSSMLSELAREIQKGPAKTSSHRTKLVDNDKIKFTTPDDDEEQARRLRDMFPTATGPVIEQMIRIYQGREGLIKAALISLGYRRATEFGAKQTVSTSPIMLMMAKPSSKKLFDKLASYFPDADVDLIKRLMYKHKEVEHEIISNLVELGQSEQSLETDVAKGESQKDKSKVRLNGAIMKLRYLKFLFPTCEEIDLYHLLHCNNLNAQKVIDEVEKRGYKRANIDEVMKNRKSLSEQIRAQQAAKSAKEKIQSLDPLEVHRSRTKPVVTGSRAESLKENLRKHFEDVPEGLLLKALEAADYSESMAKKFLDEMEPVDETKYKHRYQIHREKEPDVILFPCKGVQVDGTSFMSVTCNENVPISRNVIECENALALLKVDACTYTQDDFERSRFTHASGRKEGLATGSTYKASDVGRSCRLGANFYLKRGSNYEYMCNDESRPSPHAKANGRNKSLHLGRSSKLMLGHNTKLTQRDHPFFTDQSRLSNRNQAIYKDRSQIEGY